MSPDDHTIRSVRAANLVIIMAVLQAVYSSTVVCMPIIFQYISYACVGPALLPGSPCTGLFFCQASKPPINRDSRDRLENEKKTQRARTACCATVHSKHTMLRNLHRIL